VVVVIVFDQSRSAMLMLFLSVGGMSQCLHNLISVISKDEAASK